MQEFKTVSSRIHSSSPVSELHSDIDQNVPIERESVRAGLKSALADLMGRDPAIHCRTAESKDGWLRIEAKSSGHFLQVLCLPERVSIKGVGPFGEDMKESRTIFESIPTKEDVERAVLKAVERCF
jgi:hypothetical protein